AARASAKCSRSSPTCDRRAWRRSDRVTELGMNSRVDASSAAAPSTTTESGDFGAPLYVAWQITNECNLACLHCIEESGPGKAFGDELDEAQVFNILAQLMAHEVPYLSFSGGEPMVHPLFSQMVEHVCASGGQLTMAS